MRISPKSLSPAEALAKAKAKAQTRDDERREALENEAVEAATNMTSPAEIDASRAQRLLERATALAARGDMSAAVLATRQSLALAPEKVEAHLLHADLLERNRDFGGARAAYKKSVELAPENAGASANLARLDAYLDQSQGAARQFQFDNDELFSPKPAGMESGNNNAESTNQTVITSEPQETSADANDATSMLDQSMLPDLEARLPPVRVESPTTASVAPVVVDQSVAISSQNAVSAAEKPIATSDNALVGDRRKHNIPVATERRRRPVAGAALPLVAPVAAVPLRASVAAPLNPANPFGDTIAPTPKRAPLALDVPTAPAAPIWQQVVSRPSFYARTLPLVGVALLSLGFLSWARGRAVSTVVTPPPTELASADMTTLPDAPATVPGTTLPVPNAPAQGNAAGPNSVPATDAAGFPISNAPVVFQAPPATGANAATATGNSNRAPAQNNNNLPSTPSTTARANNRGPNSSSPRPNRVLRPARPAPNFPSVSLAPAPIPPASVRNSIPRAGANQNSGGSSIILPSPSIEMPSAPVQRQRVLPPTDNGLNPAGSPNRGYVRVTEGRVGNGVIPSQPSAVARDNERQANDAARNGQSDQAISQLSQAIRADSDNAGFRYQQRATLFLQRGDYNRATDDFQSAISAYQSQISSGDDVAQARRGLSSARSGLTLALAGKRG